MKRDAFLMLLAAMLVAVGFFPETSTAQAPPPFKIIVHPDNPTPEATRRFVVDAFLKKTTRWPTDIAIRPVDLAPDSPVRHRFTEEVLKRSVAAVKSYWQQIIFSGRGVPPPELASDEEVVNFVLRHDGGIGYVSGTADIGAARTLVVR